MFGSGLCFISYTQYVQLIYIAVLPLVLLKCTQYLYINYGMNVNQKYECILFSHATSQSGLEMTSTKGLQSKFN